MRADELIEVITNCTCPQCDTKYHVFCLICKKAFDVNTEALDCFQNHLKEFGYGIRKVK